MLCMCDVSTVGLAACSRHTPLFFTLSRRAISDRKKGVLSKISHFYILLEQEQEATLVMDKLAK